MANDKIAILVYDLLKKVETEEERLTLEDIKEYYERKGDITVKQRETIIDINLKILKKCKGVEHGENPRRTK